MVVVVATKGWWRCHDLNISYRFHFDFTVSTHYISIVIRAKTNFYGTSSLSTLRQNKKRVKVVDDHLYGMASEI